VQELLPENHLALFFYGLTLIAFCVPGCQPLWLFLGIVGTLFGAAGSGLEDGPVDVFLKYSLWGTHYRNIMFSDRETKVKLPSWWPGNTVTVDESNTGRNLIRLDKFIGTKANEAFSPFNTDKETDSPGEKTIKRHNFLNNILIQAIQAGYYQTTVCREAVLRENNIFDTLEIRFIPYSGRNAKELDFTSIKQITIDVYQAKAVKPRITNLGIFLTEDNPDFKKLDANLITVNLDRPRDVSRYLRKGYLQCVSSLEEITEAVSLNVILVKNLAQTAQRLIASNPRYVAENWPGYKETGELDSRRVQKVVIRITYKEDTGRLPVEVVEYAV
jgi:hypothetical protein